MKRIANDVAVQTLLYFCYPNQKVVVRDFDTPEDIVYHKTSVAKEVYNGESKNLVGVDYTRITQARVRHWVTRPDDSVLEIWICTKYEKY